MILLLIFVSPTVAQAQNTLSGEVLDQSGETLPSAQIVLLASGKIKGYTLTDTKGNFTIELPDTIDQGLLIEARMFGYANQAKPVTNFNDYLKFTLKAEAIEIETVEVTADALPIAQREDTLMFNTAS